MSINTLNRLGFLMQGLQLHTSNLADKLEQLERKVKIQ